MKNTSLKRELKKDRLQRDINVTEKYIGDLTKENNDITEKLLDMSKLSSNKADELMNRVIYNNGEIETSKKQIEKFGSRILKLSKEL